MIEPEKLPAFTAWRDAFVPAPDAVDYVGQNLSITDVALVANLMFPPLVEVEGCVLLKGRYAKENFEVWWQQLDHTPSAVESTINQCNLWDIFDPRDDAEEAALSELAALLAETWKFHAERTFPHRRFTTEVTDTYGPGVRLFQADPPGEQPP